MWEVRIKTRVRVLIVLTCLHSPSRANTHSQLISRLEENDMAKRKLRSRSGNDGATGPSARMLDSLHRIWLAWLGAATKTQRGAPHLIKEHEEEDAREQSETHGAAEK